MLQLKDITSKEVWEDFHLNSNYGSFLQSWDWMDFQESVGYKVLRKGIYKEDELYGIVFLKEDSSRFGKILYAPRGPIIDWNNEELVDEVLYLLKKNFEGKGYFLIKLDPAIKKDNKDIIDLFINNGYQNAVMPAQTENPWILEIIGGNDEEQLKWMREHGRRKKFGNFISSAKRAGVQIKYARSKEEITQFTRLLHDMADRKELQFQDDDYFIKMKEKLNENMLVPIAYLNNEPIAGAVIIVHKDESSYIYGASSPKTGQTHATHLLHWDAIHKAKEMGVKRYNFWGVLTDEDYVPENPGYGYSNFKRSFGGYIEPLIKPMEFSYNKLLYPTYQTYQKYLRNKLKNKGYL